MIHYTELEHLFDGIIDCHEYNIETYSELLELPFATYIKSGEESLSADGICYFKTVQIQLELIMETLNDEVQFQIESKLKEAEIYYTASLEYDSDQRIYIKIYSFFVLS